MNILKRFIAFLPVLTLVAGQVFAQDKPIGYWEAHLPYNNAVGVATDGINVFAICNQSFFTDNNSTGQQEAYSKVEGMSDVGMQYAAYDAATSTVVLAYTDANIDLFKDNTFYNIPDLEIKTVAGVKNINHIYTENGIAYLSTSIGILVVDLTNKNIQETYQFTINSRVVPINGFYGSGDYYYAITPSGFFRALKSNPELQNFAVWQKLDSTRQFTSITSSGDNLFVATHDSLFLFNDSLKFLYKSATSIRHLDQGSAGIWISEENLTQSAGGDVKKLNLNYNITDSFSCAGRPVQVAELLDGSLWVADSLNGTGKRTGNQITLSYPAGPADPNAVDIYAYNKDVWIAHGGYNDKYVDNNNRNGFSNLHNGAWTIYQQSNYPPVAGMTDFVAILKDQVNGTVYAGSFHDGLFILNADGSNQLVRNPTLDQSVPNAGLYPVIGLALDHEDDLWMTMFGASHELLAKTPDSTWYKFSLPYSRPYPYAGGPLIVDDNDQEWYVCADGGGAVVYNNNGTISNPTDDASYHLTTGAGYGNLPSNNVFSIAKDNNNDIWIGTDNGIGIVSCAGSMTTSPCDANIPIVQYDQFAGYLFSGENVRTIAVDGANRKWVGTDNGVWLLSPDASTIVYRFTSANSPLPSNHVEKISVDPITGDVYIGTDQGLMTYRSTATQGGDVNQNVLVFPDPVPSGYHGTIAIKGLVANADVRITDITGQLVYRTTALGGQAVWNGMDYTGHRPQSGVYLIFVTNSDGSQTYSGKMVFMN